MIISYFSTELMILQYLSYYFMVRFECNTEEPQQTINLLINTIKMWVHIKMERYLNIFILNKCSTVFMLMESNMVMVFYQIFWFTMKDNLLMAKNKGKVRWFSKMEMSIEDSLRIINLTAKGNINGKMDKSMMVSSAMDLRMVLESIIIQIKILIRVCTNWIKNMAKGYINGKMVQFMKDNFKMIISMQFIIKKWTR